MDNADIAASFDSKRNLKLDPSKMTSFFSFTVEAGQGDWAAGEVRVIWPHKSSALLLQFVRIGSLFPSSLARSFGDLVVAVFFQLNVCSAVVGLFFARRCRKHRPYPPLYRWQSASWQYTQSNSGGLFARCFTGSAISVGLFGIVSSGACLSLLWIANRHRVFKRWHFSRTICIGSHS